MLSSSLNVSLCSEVYSFIEFRVRRLNDSSDSGQRRFVLSSGSRTEGLLKPCLFFQIMTGDNYPEFHSQEQSVTNDSVLSFVVIVGLFSKSNLIDSP